MRFEDMFADAVLASARDVARPLVTYIGEVFAAAPPELRYAIAADVLSSSLAAVLATMPPDARERFRLFVEGCTEACLAHVDAALKVHRVSRPS